MISGKNNPHLPGSSAAHAFHENRPPTKAHNLHSRTGLFRNATSLQQRKKNESSADTTKLLPTDEVHRTKRAPSLFPAIHQTTPGFESKHTTVTGSNASSADTNIPLPHNCLHFLPSSISASSHLQPTCPGARPAHSVLSYSTQRLHTVPNP